MNKNNDESKKSSKNTIFLFMFAIVVIGLFSVASSGIFNMPNLYTTLAFSNNASNQNITSLDYVYANYFVGDGSFLTNLSVNETTLNDTLQTVTDRGSTTTNDIILTGGKNALIITGDYTQTTPAINGRETLAEYYISDAGNDAFGISQGTSAHREFAPTFYGYKDSDDDIYSINFRAMTNPANDVSMSSVFGLINMEFYRTTSATDPNNGVFTGIQNRKLLTMVTGVEEDRTYPFTLFPSNQIDMLDIHVVDEMTIGNSNNELVGSSAGLTITVGNGDTTKFKQQNGSWQNIEVANIIEHTENSTLQNPLEWFNDVDCLDIAKVPTYDVDYDRPVSKKIEEYDGTTDETYERVITTYPHIIQTGYGCDATKEKAEIRGALGQLNSAFDVIKTSEGVILDADILSAETIYTESKTAKNTETYLDKFNTEIFTKETHPAYENDVAGKPRLNLEDRIVNVEGALEEQNKINENQRQFNLCVINAKNFNKLKDCVANIKVVS